MKKFLNILKKLINIFNKIEEIILVIIFSIMIIFSFLQIFFRTVWFDSVIKYSVLWTGFIAASIAALDRKHIKIDLIGRLAKGRFKSLVLLITNFFASSACIFLSYASVNYILKIEKLSTDPPPFLNIPRWILLIIIPFGFAVIGLRFLFRSVKKLYNLIKNEEDEKDS
ncbi:MAG: TRAP transporter small permease subunit [Spirochaetes bacterium]|nr:TRAP transporter small permease subunit [Spirochaetota bacterium]